MDQMMNSVFGGIQDPMADMPFGGGMFGNFAPMMSNHMMLGSHMNSMNNHMNSQMQMLLGRGGGQSQSFSSTTFTSYSSNGPNGQPQVHRLYL